MFVSYSTRSLRKGLSFRPGTHSPRSSAKAGQAAKTLATTSRTAAMAARISNAPPFIADCGCAASITAHLPAGWDSSAGCVLGRPEYASSAPEQPPPPLASQSYGADRIVERPEHGGESKESALGEGRHQDLPNQIPQLITATTDDPKRQQRLWGFDRRHAQARRRPPRRRRRNQASRRGRAEHALRRAESLLQSRQPVETFGKSAHLLPAHGPFSAVIVDIHQPLEWPAVTGRMDGQCQDFPLGSHRECGDTMTRHGPGVVPEGCRSLPIGSGFPPDSPVEIDQILEAVRLAGQRVLDVSAKQQRLKESLRKLGGIARVAQQPERFARVLARNEDVHVRAVTEARIVVKRF